MDSFDGIIEFAAVAETGGFTAAAQRLGASTSHISRQVARLEQRLGVQLLVRTTRAVGLTAEGQAYFDHCRELLNGLAQANDSVGSAEAGLTGTLRVSAAGAFAERVLTPALIDFAEAHPGLGVSLDFNSRMVDFLSDEVDFAVRYGRLEDSGLIARKLVDRKMVAAAAPAYLAQHGTPERPEDLSAHACLIANSNQWRFAEAGEEMVVRVSGPWRSNNAHATMAACVRGLGIAYMPRTSFLDALASGALVPVLERFSAVEAASWIVYRNRRFQPLRVRLGIDFLVERFKGWRE